MIRKIIRLSFLLCSLLFAAVSDAQLVVNTTILPPYSPYLADYVSYGNKIVILVVNPTPITRNIKLMGSITGNGISIKTKTNFMPSTPIMLAGTSTTQLLGSQLVSYYNTDNLTLQGITANELVYGNGLPEGIYTFCYYAADYITGVPLSDQNLGCATITISHHEPPLLIQPVCGNKVTPHVPQNVLFSWTVPAGVNPIDIEYELTVVKLLPGQNPTQALAAATDPVFFRKTIPVSSYMYSQVDPALTAGSKYAWRVRAKAKPGKNANFKNNGYSAACDFEYKAGQGGGGFDPKDNLANTPQTPNYLLPGDDNACISDCEIAMPANQSPYSPIVGDTISMGKFAMIISTINGPSGTGMIAIPFMKAKVLVDFSNLQVNTDRQAIGNSKAIAHLQGNNLYATAIANDPNGEIQMTRDQFNAIDDFVMDGQRLTSKFVPSMQAVGVPFAMDKNGMNLLILGLIFTPTKGHLNTMYGYNMPDWFGNDFVDFSKKGLCIRPNGFGVAPKFSLANDRVIQLSDFVDLKFLKGDQTTYVELDCDGIKTVKLGGEYLISREKLLPVENNAVVGGNTRVKVPFSVTVSQGGNWMFNSNMVPSTFTIPDAQDFRFAAGAIVLDLHNTQNPNGIVFHPNHPAHGGNNKDWKGLYIADITVTMPDGFQKKGQKITFAVEDMMIDKSGFWGEISASNVVTIADGSVGNWQFSISNVSIDIQASALAGGSMAGNIKIPIAETSLAYTCAIQKGNNGTDWQFGITLQNDLSADLWKAKLNLEEGSTVSISKEGNVITPVALLNGTISVGFTESPNDQTPLSKLALNGIKFQELKVTGGQAKPTIDLAFISLENQPSGMFSMNKFPINLTALSYDNGVKPGIIFGLHVNLSKGTNAFEAETIIKVKAKWNGNAKKFEFEGIELQKIHIDTDLGVMHIIGDITIYKDDAEFGTGFRGDMSAAMKFVSLAITATIQLGKIGDSDQPEETASNYRYFFVDIGARFGAGLPLPGVPAVAFYGFGGGVYRNMNRVGVAEMLCANIPDKQGAGTMTAGETRSGVKYTPKKGTFGFMASVTIGTTGEPTSFNADLKLIVQFNTDNFGVTKIVLEGHAYLMGPITDRNKKLLKVDIDIEMDFEKPMFHAAITIDGGFNQSVLKVTVKASLALHFEPGTWYVKLGEWSQDDEPWKDPKRIQIDIALGSEVIGASLNFNAYFMMGTDIGQLPRSPLKVREALGLVNNEPTKTVNEMVFIGKGFAMGLGIHFEVEANFFIFYANLEFILGADVLLSKTTATCNGNMNYGINGWYAKGIAYAYLHGDIGLRLKLFGFSGEFSLLEFTAAAQMQAELPNPNWIKGNFAISGSILNGLITVSTRFTLEVGEKCAWADGSGDELPIINELLPEDGGEGSVFEAPQAAFNYEMDKEFVLKDYSIDPKGKSRKFKMVIKRVELARGFAVIPGKYHYNAAKNGITFLADETLEAHKEYKFTVVVEAHEKVSGKWKVLKPETKFVKFTSGARPDYIAEQNVISAFPQREQRFYLCKDDNRGDIRLGLSQCYLLDSLQDKDYTYEYKLRLTNQETKNFSDHAFVCNGKHFTWTVPQNVIKETVYEVKVLRIGTPKAKPLNLSKNTKHIYEDENGNLVAAPTQPGNLYNNNLPLNNNIPNNGGMNMPLNLANGPASKLVVRHNKVKEQQSVGTKTEKELFKYYFRTSKHNTAEEKYGNGYKVAAGYGAQSYAAIYNFAGGSYPYVQRALFPLLVGQENMDTYEAYGYYKENFDVFVDPLAKPELKWGSNNYFKNLDTRIYEYKYKGGGTPYAYDFASNRYAKGNANFFGLTTKLFSMRPIEAVKMWNQNSEGPIDLPENQNMMKPKGKLSTNEINLAKQGQKIVESLPKNPVLPMNIYLGSVVYSDATAVYSHYRNRCYDDHNLKSYKADCILNYAKPAITYSPAAGGYTTENPYNLKIGDNCGFMIKYGYWNNDGFKKDLIFKP